MRRIRVIPTLLLQNEGLYKTKKFKNPIYIGDPINAIKIFNDKRVDELALIDISASKMGKGPNFSLIEHIASECFMPLAYGGGIKTLEQAQKLFALGLEKVILNSVLFEDLSLIQKIANQYGAQSVVACVDVSKSLFSKEKVYNHLHGKTVKGSVLDWCKQIEQAGAGEIILQCVYKEGTLKGYDVELLHQITSSLSIPVIALSGASNIDDFYQAIDRGGASAVAAGSLFVFKNGDANSILINYPSPLELKEKLFQKL